MSSKRGPSSSSKIISFFLVLLNALTLAGLVTFMCLYLTKKESVVDSNKISWPPPSLTPLGKYAKVAVAADNQICSEIGRSILLAGGNAADAAVASLLCIGVTDAHSAGLGGGHFATVYDASSRQCHGVDARETAPAAATENMYVNKWNESEFGWRAIAVPGELHGLWRLYSKFGSGRVSWSRLVQPTIQLVDDGVPVTSNMVDAFREVGDWLEREPTMQAFINQTTRRPLGLGEQVARPALAGFLRALAAAPDPVQLFYNSAYTERLVLEIQQNGGLLTTHDFAQYTSILHSPDAMMTARLPSGRVICGPPPPSSAAVAIGILRIMDGFQNSLSTLDEAANFFHRFIEASKFAYSGRTWLGDPAFVANATDIARNLTTKTWSDWARSRITPEAHPDAYYGGSFAAPPIDHGTTHISIVDGEGNAVSVTSTVNLFFGAKVASTSTGIIWNDEMDDFSTPGHPNYFGFEPSPANFIRPGKRPLSSMSPLVIVDNDGSGRLMSVGAAGGSTIITGTAGIALHTLWLNSTVKEAIDFPRLHNQLEPNYTTFEEDFPPELLKALRQRGQTFHKSANITEATGAVREADGQLYANSDFRKGQESAPAGY